MGRPQPHRRREMLPWIAALLLVPGFCWAWASAVPTRLPVASYDTGYHLAVGRWITEHGTVPRTDPFCFSTEGLDWINLNWLAQIGFYSIYDAWGLVGLEAFRLLVMTGTLFFLWLACRAARAPPLPALAVMVLAALVLAQAPQIRPRLLSFLLVSMLAWGLARPDPEHQLSFPAAIGIAVVVLLFNNLHGGFLYAYAILGADAGGTAITSWRAGGPKLPRRSLLLGAVVLVGLLSFGLHPHGFAALEHAVDYMGRLGELVISITVEVQPANFTSYLGRLLEAAIAFALVGFIWGRRPPLRAWLVLVPFLQLALQMKRGLPLLIFVGGATAASSWRGLPLGTWWTAANRIMAPSWRTIGPALLCVSLTLATVSLVAWSAPGRPGDVESPDWNPRVLPVGPARYLQSAGGEGRIFAKFGHANLLEWALYPQRRVFIDGRTDLHARGKGIAISQAIETRFANWEELLRELLVEHVVLERKSQLARLLSKRKWSVVFLDKTWIVFKRN